MHVTENLLTDTEPKPIVTYANIREWGQLLDMQASKLACQLAPQLHDSVNHHLGKTERDVALEFARCFKCHLVEAMIKQKNTNG